MTSEAFFAFARARHEITLRRAAGLPRPWTDDPILGHHRFTNVFREMDRTTKWIADNVRVPLDRMLERGEIEPWQQVLGLILAREFNRTTTLEQIFCQTEAFDGLLPAGWSYLRGGMSIAGLEAVMRAHCRRPWVTGAYIVKTPDGMDKLAGALWMVERARERLPVLAADRSFACSMQALHADLQGFPYLGGFTAYEVVTDLRWMTIGRDWPDINTWACAGPGAIRGLHRVHGRARETGEVRPDGSKIVKFPAMGQSQALAEMRDLLRDSQSVEFWPQDDGTITRIREGHKAHWPEIGTDVGEALRRGDWPVWELREVEHTLCEFDKYERARLGQGAPRGVYR